MSPEEYIEYKEALKVWRAFFTVNPDDDDELFEFYYSQLKNNENT